MTAVIIEPAAVAVRESRKVECAAPDHELLLVEWLNALIYLMSVERMLFSRFAVEHLERSRLQGEAAGEKLDPARHHAVVEVKGATYTMLSVRQQGGLWVAQTVVDV